MQGHIKWAKVEALSTFKTLPNTLLLLGHESLGGKEHILIEAPLLGFHQSHLEQDGYAIIHFLNELRTQSGQCFGLMGGFQDIGLFRYHLILPTAETALSNFLVYEWRFDEWLTKTTTVPHLKN